jgi:hypothetical protein
MKILFVQTNYPGFLRQFYDKYPDWQNWIYQEWKRKWAGEWFGTADFFAKNLKPLGWTGDEVVINDINSQNLWMKGKGLTGKYSDNIFTSWVPESVKNYLGWRNWVKNILFEQIEIIHPDVVYMHDLSILDESDLRKVKRKSKLLVGQIACPLPVNTSPFKEYQLLISSFPHYVTMFKNWGINSEYLKWCIESSIPKIIGEKPRTYGAVFIGGLIPAHGQGNRVLEKLAKQVPLDIWGYGENTLSPISPIRHYFHGQAWGKKMYEIFARSKIVVNRHINVARNVANNMRMFEATGMGALLITEDRPNLKDFFIPGREIVTYKNSGDLIEKVKYYLAHNSERAKIATAGQKRTLKDHTYKQRMKDLDRILKDYL